MGTLPKFLACRVSNKSRWKTKFVDALSRFGWKWNEKSVTALFYWKPVIFCASCCAVMIDFIKIGFFFATITKVQSEYTRSKRLNHQFSCFVYKQFFHWNTIKFLTYDVQQQARYVVLISCINSTAIIMQRACFKRPCLAMTRIFLFFPLSTSASIWYTFQQKLFIFYSFIHVSIQSET